MYFFEDITDLFTTVKKEIEHLEKIELQKLVKRENFVTLSDPNRKHTDETLIEHNNNIFSIVFSK